MSSYLSSSLTVDVEAHKRLRAQLWTDAYGCLEREEPLLVDTYERMLSLHLSERVGAAAVTGPQENDLKIMGPEERQQSLEDIMENNSTRSKSSASTKSRLNESNENLEFVNELVGYIQAAGKEVAFVWVGVYLALKFLLRSETPQIFDRDAVAFLISRMNFPWDTSVLLIDKNRTTGFTTDSREYLEKCLIRVYTAVLSWQMKAISAYYCEQESLFPQGLPSVSDWKEIEDNIREEEVHILSIIFGSNTWKIDHHLRGLLNTANSVGIKLRALHLGDVPTVCAACGNLDPSIWGRKRYSTFIMDVQHASSKCSACMVIATGVSAIVKPLDESAELSLSVQKENSLRVHYYLGPHDEEGTHLEFYIHQDHTSPWPAIKPARSLRSTTYFRSMELVSGWFHRCLSEDRTCRVRESTLPTRAVCVGNESREPYLYETRREEASYTALSHCWGGAQHIRLTTTTADLKDRMDSIPISALPKTFADAVLLTRELGIKYIWIDSLCILQDDVKDWARESGRMAAVYQNAALTISADGAANGSEGLFKPTEAPIFEEVSIPFHSPSGFSLIYVRKTTLHSNGDHVHVITHKHSDPLRHRGWVLQEWLLSGRIVHFTKGELLWECKELQFCHCQVTSQLSINSSKGDFYKKEERDRGREYLDWSQVVVEFTRRQLTVWTDRLPALSGLAAFTKLNAAEDYIAGLWKSELPEALLWKVESGASERHEGCYAPSWSWASIKGSVSFQTVHSWDNTLPLKCKVLELVTVPTTDNPFGPLKSGFITIQGPVGTLSKDLKRKGKMLGELAQHRGSLALDVKGTAFEVTSAAEIPFLIIKRETTNTDEIFGIALKRLKDEDQFMRVGYVSIKYRGSNWESWMLNDLKVKKQIVTIV